MSSAHNSDRATAHYAGDFDFCHLYPLKKELQAPLLPRLIWLGFLWANKSYCLINSLFDCNL